MRLLADPASMISSWWSIKRCGHVFAHLGPIGAGAIQFDLLGGGEQTFPLAGHGFHNGVGEFPLQEFDQRVDFASTLTANFSPKGFFERGNGDLDAVEF